MLTPLRQGEYTYLCEEHGYFDMYVEGEDVFEQMCPVCSRACDYQRRPPPSGPPMIAPSGPRSQFFSLTHNKWFKNKRDHEAEYDKRGAYPMTEKDVKDAIENSANASHRAQKEMSARGDTSDCWMSDADVAKSEALPVQAKR